MLTVNARSTTRKVQGVTTPKSGLSVSGPFVCRCLIIRTVLRFHIPLIEPDMRCSRIRLLDRTSNQDHCFSAFDMAALGQFMDLGGADLGCLGEVELIQSLGPWQSRILMRRAMVLRSRSSNSTASNASRYRRTAAAERDALNI